MLIGSSFPHFKDSNGNPLDAGYIFYGQPNLNPETNPITVYWDSGLTQPASQPIRTLNGYITRDGAIANIYCASSYSITVKNKVGILLYSMPDSTQFDLNFQINNKLNQFITVKDFGAIGDNIAVEDSFFALAKANAKAYFVPSGTYKFSGAFDSGNTPIISLGAVFNLGVPATTYFRSFIDIGQKAITRQSIRDSSEYSGTPTSYTYLKTLASFNILHNSNAGYQQQFTSDSGGRTAIPAIYIEGSQSGYGDIPGVSVHFGVSRHAQWASISGSWTGANSAVCYDGEITATTANVNVYGAEYHLGDNGNDRVAANGLVLDFARNNGNPSNFGAYNTVWTGVRLQTSGTYAADSGLSINGKWKVGIDFTGAILSNNAAISLKSNDRIYFGAPATSPPKWYDDALSTTYQVFDGTKFNFVVNNIAAFTVAQAEITSSAIHKFINSFNIVSAGNIASTVGAAGPGSALPATPFTYLKIQIDGTTCKIPVYNN